MSDLIKALQILLKYGNPIYPTHCEHGILFIADIDLKQVTDEDKASLEELGFSIRTEYGKEQFYSYRFGSALKKH